MRSSPIDAQTPPPSPPSLSPILIAAPETTPEQRSEVHRKLGRCLLRAQQYEMLTKAILIDHEQSGSITNWEARRQARIDKFAKMTLGKLIEWMKESYLRSGAESSPNEDSEPPEGLDQIWFSFRVGVQMEVADYQRTVAAMEELVALRNEIVHHFLERFNLWTLEGCRAADIHLEQSYELIDRHMVDLGEWSRHMDEARRVAASFMASEEYLDHVLGRATVAAHKLDQSSPIAQRLREAEARLALDGWVLLDDAIAFIGRVDREEVPKRYGCKNWRQVLTRSGAFEVMKQALPERSGLYTVYRTLP